VQLSVIDIESTPDLLDFSFKIQYLGFTLKVFGKFGFSAMLTHNKGHLTRGHRWRFTGIKQAVKSDKINAKKHDGNFR
jgi:hypothetical protein